MKLVGIVQGMTLSGPCVAVSISIRGKDNAQMEENSETVVSLRVKPEQAKEFAVGQQREITI
jgi:hypothetical protein